jgi:hypothetical protein
VRTPHLGEVSTIDPQGVRSTVGATATMGLYATVDMTRNSRGQPDDAGGEGWSGAR